MPGNLKPFVHMAIYTVVILVGAYGLGWLILGKTWTQTSWTEEKTGRFVSEVRSYQSYDKRIISGVVARTQARWHIQCDNQGVNKVYLAFDRPLEKPIQQIKLFWDDHPPQEYKIQSADQKISFDELPESAQQEIRDRLNNSFAVAAEIDFGQSMPNRYKWDLRQVDKKIAESAAACFDQLDLTRPAANCILCQWAQTGDLAKIDYLLTKARLPINQGDRLGKTPLMYSRKLKTAVRLLAAGAEINQKDDQGHNALWWFDQNNNYEMIKLLIDRGATPEPLEATGDTLLHQRVRETPGDFNDQQIAKLYRDAGIMLTVRNKLDETPLALAVKLGKTGFLDIFLPLAPEILRQTNQQGETLLHLAYQDAPGHSDYIIVKKLLASGLDVNARDQQGQTPLYPAVRAGNYGLVEYLLQNGANPHLEAAGETLLHEAAQKPGSIPIIKLLQMEGFNINSAKTAAGETVLFTAIRHNNYPGVKFLLGAGARAENKNRAGQTPLNVAAQQRRQIQIREAQQTQAARPEASYEVIASQLVEYYAQQKENNRKIISLLRRPWQAPTRKN